MIHLCTHINPDGDAIGAVFGTAHILRHDQLEVTVHLWGDFPAWFGKVWDYLGRPDYTTDPVPPGARIWLLDAPHPDRCGAGNVPPGVKLDMHIDHHPASHYPTIDAYIDEDASSACELVVEYFRTWVDSGAKIRDPLVGAWLALGIRTDTLGMTTRATTDRTFSALARLSSRSDGVERIHGVNQILRRTVTRDTLRFRAMAILTASWFDGVCILRIPSVMRGTYGINENDAKVVLADTGSLADIDLVVLLVESDDGRRVRCSFRSQSEGRAQRMAILFGGGGHAQASGATVEASLSEVYDRIVELL